MPATREQRKHLIQVKAYRQADDGILMPQRPNTSAMDPGTLVGTIGSHSTIQDLASPEKLKNLNVMSFDSQKHDTVEKLEQELKKQQLETSFNGKVIIKRTGRNDNLSPAGSQVRKVTGTSVTSPMSDKETSIASGPRRLFRAVPVSYAAMRSKQNLLNN